MLRGGAVVDDSIIKVATSTKNKDKNKDVARVSYHILFLNYLYCSLPPRAKMPVMTSCFISLPPLWYNLNPILWIA